MEHFLDISIVSIVILFASAYIYRTIKKARNGCGSICSSCSSSSCQSKVKSFANNKVIKIKSVH